ncbi:HEAT repeat domain-containing protein [Streptomyces sp. NPDC052077]|uniref:HEAT repeat domain-containing protein n=1 Tax=Streptomyces sp. NPDC052077 TaxID=3154757 RepID=UPI003418302D
MTMPPRGPRPDTRTDQGAQGRTGPDALGRAGAHHRTDAETRRRTGTDTRRSTPAHRHTDTDARRALRALEHGDPSVRLKAAMAVGTAPDPRFVEPLVIRCGIEPEFFVRETLTWALTRHADEATVPRLIAELGQDRPQARSQALHTLSKIGDRRAWPALTRELLADPDEEVARAAWRAAVALVPEGGRAELAGVLATRLGRGEHRTRASLSRALVALGEVVLPVLAAATVDPDPRVRHHAVATERLWHDPEAGFESAVEEAKRVVALGGTGREE